MTTNVIKLTIYNAEPLRRMEYNVMKEKDENQGYTTISIPISLAEKIDEAIKKGLYQNRPDFVRDAIRKLLKEKEA